LSLAELDPSLTGSRDTSADMGNDVQVFFLKKKGR
jgi:hypothetical protein